MTRAADLAKLIAGGGSITVSDNSDNVTLTSTDADANAGPNLRMYRNSASPADVDRLGHITFDGRNDNSQDFTAAQIQVFTEDASDGTEDSSVTFTCINGGSSNNAIQINPTETTFNESSVDRDFRVESNGLTNAFMVDGGNNGIGFGHSPRSDLHTSWTQSFFGTEGSIISQRDSGGGIAGMSVTYNAYIDTDTGSYAYIATDEASILTQQNGSLHYRNAASGTAGNAITFDTKLQIDADGHVTMPKQSAFLVTKSGAQDNLTAGTEVTITFDSEIFDQNNDFSSNTFTAPVDGRYYLQVKLNLGSTDADSSNFQTRIITSNRTHSFNFDPSAFDKDTSNHTVMAATLADMDANDTCTFKVFQSGGLNQCDVSSSSTASGYLVC